jgi:hypothetical protein
MRPCPTILGGNLPCIMGITVAKKVPNGISCCINQPAVMERIMIMAGKMRPQRMRMMNEDEDEDEGLVDGMVWYGMVWYGMVSGMDCMEATKDQLNERVEGESICSRSTKSLYVYISSDENIDNYSMEEDPL